jgi:hypothetical protein
MVLLRRPRSVVVIEPVADDASTSSTLTVHGSSKPIIDEEELDEKPEREKRVAFNLEDNIEYSNTALTKNDRKALWYTARELKLFRIAALDSAQQIVKVEERNRAPFSYKRVMERTYDICSLVSHDNDDRIVIPDTDFVHVQRWMEVATSRVGLEKWAIRKVALDKLQRREDIVKAVSELTRVPCSATTSAVDKEEFIRYSCERISRPSCLFARTLAQAQAAAVKKENNFHAHTTQ